MSEINEKLLAKLNESVRNKVEIENKEIMFRIIAKKDEHSVYLLYEDFPLDQAEAGVPSELILKGSSRGATSISEKHRSLTDLENLHRNFINWLVDQPNTTLFSF